MSEQTFVLGSEKELTKALPSMKATLVDTPDALGRECSKASPSSVWVALKPDAVRWFKDCPAWRGRDRRLLLLTRQNVARESLARAFFRTVVSVDDGFWLSRDTLLEVLAASNREELLIGGQIDEADDAVVLYRGDLSVVVVPMEWFVPSGRGVKPDFSAAAIEDYGQTLRLGDYEASVHAVLYEFDKHYRRRAKARALEKDKSFGGAVKRRRLMLRMSQNSFAPDISAKEISRLEAGHVAKPHGRTLEVLARHLKIGKRALAKY